MCQKFCPAGAINFEQEPEELTLNASSIIVSTGFDLFNPSVITEFGYKIHKNIITSLEFERLINASGPTRGKLLRPSDNRIAHKVAFIQCVGSRSQRTGLPFCSSVCCMYATKQAISIKDHEPTSEVCIFYIDLKTFGKGFQEFVNRARENWGVKYINRRPSDIMEDPKSEDLLLRYEDPVDMTVKEMVADLVVLCPAFVPKPSTEKIAQILNLETDEYGFFKTKEPFYASVDTNVDGIFVCGGCQGPKDISESVVQASAAAERAAEASYNVCRRED